MLKLNLYFNNVLVGLIELFIITRILKNIFLKYQNITLFTFVGVILKALIKKV